MVWDSPGWTLTDSGVIFYKVKVYLNKTIFRLKLLSKISDVDFVLG